MAAFHAGATQGVGLQLRSTEVAKGGAFAEMADLDARRWT